MVDAEEFKLPEGIKDPAAEFDLHENLGKGSFGAVFKATYKKTGHEVAVKEVIVNEDFMEILKEINIMKQCKSRSTLKGLSYLHRSNKIHRDIKPGNILVTGKGECKLADFGVSGTLSERTRKRNTVIGTPFFLAPEVIQEVGYDSKADIWALGITAIEMAEQNPPYYDVHPMRVLFLIPTNPPPTLKAPANWSSEFSDFLRCCLDKDPARRWSAKQLIKHPFVAKAKSSAVMRPLIDQAQVVIDAAGGRLQALKEISTRKAQADPKDKDHSDAENSDHGNDDNESDSDSDSDSSDEERPKDKNISAPSAPEKSNNQASILELDNILSGILSKSSGNNSPAATQQPQSPSQASTPTKVKATPEEELDALLSGLQAKAKISSQSKPPASPSAVRKPAASSSPRTSVSLSSPAPAKPPASPLASAERSLSISGNWDSMNCGGCSNSPDWRKNPQCIL